MTDSVPARNNTTRTAILANWGFPAPSSFETRVLQKCHEIYMDEQIDMKSIHYFKLKNMLSIGKVINLAAAPNPYGIVKCNVEIVRLNQAK